MKNKFVVFFHRLYRVVSFPFRLVWYVLMLPFRIGHQLLQLISDRLRFSISLKITFSYIVLFLVIFSVMSTGIISSFSYFVQNHPAEDYLQLLWAILSIFSLVGLGAITFIGSRASRRLLAPIQTMTGAVKDISIQALDRRLDVSGAKDELKELAITFNDMLDRIGKSVEQQNRFVSDASHELRTPIAVIKGYADLLDRWGKDDRQVLEEAVAAIQSEAESMNSLLEKLLFLARADNNRQHIEMQSFSLSELVEEVLRETRLIAPGHRIESSLNEDVLLVADRKLIKEAVRIFMDNSVKYTPAGGTVCLNGYQRNNRAIISIEDSGSGIAREDLGHVFDRFYRTDQSRAKSSGGAGLGLAIAKQIVDSHQGEIRIWSAPEAGTAVRISLPL